MKRILYILICTAVWLMCIPGANAQVNDDGLTRSGEVSAYDGTRADFLTVAGKLSRYPKLSKAGESLKYAPIVTTDSVPAVYITAESARVYGNILFNGWFENVTAKGFELSTNADFPETATVQYPVVSETNQYVECDQPCTQNVFDLVIDQLQSSTTYYVRAFATNAKGTSYGEALTFTTLTAMNVAALPYFTDFSEEGDNENWFLNNGNCTNYWMMGTDLLNQNPALFITTNGETPGYNDLKPVTVMAERLLLMDASDSLTINLDVRMYGESSYDYLKVFLAPKSMLFSAADTNVTPYSGHSYSQYALRFPSGDYSYVTDNDGSRYLHLSCLIDNPLSAGDTAKLVFLWCNDRSTLREPPAIISSVEVIPLRIKTDSVSDIAYNAAAVYSTMTTTLTENLQRGLCYSKYPGVTLGGENCINVVLDQLNGSYSYNLTDLVPNTKYYVRAYALSGNGVISYGDELSFQTEHSTFVVTLPYKTNFSDGYDWLVEHTISTTQNYWNFGLLTDYTDSAMYVTYNDGTQAQYYTSATTNISAGRLLRMPQTDSVHVTFYVNCGGEGSYDWMKVLLVPVNEDITTDHYAFDYNTNAMDFSNYLSQTGNQNGPYKLNLTDGTLRIAANLKNPTLQDGDTAKLVFLWHTDGGSGTQPGPIITDLYVSVLDVDVYTDNVSDITDNSAKVNGYVHNPNNEIISKVGVCYGKHINPTFEDNFVESTSINADNTFILPISNLDYNTTYYVRTFMKVGDEVFFGDQIKFMTGMAVIPDELPYVTDFSDRQQWWMNSGDCQNYWKTGKLTDDGDSMLFITNDSLYLDTCGYFTSQYTFVTAEKYLKMPDNQNPIELTFDVSVGGESSYDYLMVYLCPMDQSFTPNSTTSVVPVTTNAFDFRHYKNVASGSTDLSRYYFNLTDGNVVHINDLMNNPTPGDTAKLVFLWRTDASAGTQPGPVISNLSVAEYVTDNVLPYSTNFSSDNEEWILYSGASKNYFMTGVPAGTTQSALFVTHDGDTCSYLPDVTSFTTAETYFSFPENDSLLLEFDAKAGGEGCCDYLMAFVSQWDVEYNAENVVNATSDNMGAVPFIGYSSDMSSTNTYRIQLTNGSDLHHFSVKVKNPARNGLGKLVFAWRNDGSGGSAPFDVMVTNVSLTIPATPFICGTNKMVVPGGQEYETVEIGGMCWTKTNLREPAGTNKTSDMTMSSSEPYYYVRPDANDSIYGYCYNWEAAKIACPAGWHLPSDAEWNVMESNWTAMDVYTTGERGDHAGKLAYGDEWAYSSRSGAPGDKLYNDRNLSQFSARAIGRVYGYNSGTFENSNYDAWFWTSSTRMSNLNYWLTQPIYHRLVSSYVGVQRGTIMQNIGSSVRCVKDMEVTSTTCATLGTTSQNGDEFSTSVSVPQGATVVGQYYTVYAAGVSLDNNYYSPELSETGAQLNNGNVVATLDLLDFAGRTVDVTAHAIVAGCDTQMTVIDGTPLSVIVPLPDICPEFVAGSANAMMNDDGTLSLSVSVNPNDYVNSIFWNNVDVDFIVSYSNGEGTYEESFEGNFYFNNPYNDPNDNEIIFYASNHFEGFVVSNVEARMSYANCEEQSITFPSVLMCPSFGPEGSHSVLTDLATGDYQIRIPVLNSENYDESDYFCYLDFPDQSSNGFLQDGYAYFPIPSEYNEDTMDVTLTIMGPNCSSSYSIEDFNVHTTPAADQCPYTFILVDNYGDGWNGGFLEVVQNEVVVDTLIALDHQIQSTQTKDTVTLELIDGVNISLVWNKGYYDHEVGIDLFGPDDNLLYTVNGLSDTANNTAIFSFTANCETSPVISTCPATVEDVDGNVYSTVQIGDQCWMKQNLRTTHFADSTAITFGTPSSSHYVEEPPYYYNNTDSEMDLNERGYLYNWFAVMNGADASSSNPSGVQGICPNGWHVPSNAEWEQFYNQGGLNSGSGFSPVYAGYVVSTTFDSEGWGAYFWTTTSAGVGEWNIPLAVGRHIDSYDGSLLLSDSMSFDAGYSVRCVKNADDGDNTESCPSLGVSQEADSITAQYVYSPVIDFDADKIYNDYCGYGVFAGGSNVLIVRGKDYPNLVNTSFIEDNGSYNLWVTIDFDLIATAAQSKNVQVSSGDPITIMPILNLNGCPESESYGSTVILTMP